MMFTLYSFPLTPMSENESGSAMSAIVAIVAIIAIAGVAYFAVQYLQNQNEDSNTIIDVQLPSGEGNETN